MKFRDLIMKISAQERKKRQYQRDADMMQKIERLSDQELLFQYTRLNVSYEHQKRFFSLILIVIFTSGVSGVWKVFFDFTKKNLQRSAVSMIYTEEEISGLLIVVLLLCIIISIILLAIVFYYMMEMRNTHKELLLTEKVYEKRQH